MLAIGIAALASLVAAHRDILSTVEDLQRKLTSSPPSKVAPPKNPHLTTTSPQAMREVIYRLNLPWDSLFAALEKATAKEIALVAIQPDPAKGTITLRGEGRNLYTVLRYLQALNSGGFFHELDLVEHEISAQNPDLPVRFTISGQWLAEGPQR